MKSNSNRPDETQRGGIRTKTIVSFSTPKEDKKDREREGKRKKVAMSKGSKPKDEEILSFWY